MDEKRHIESGMESVEAVRGEQDLSPEGAAEAPLEGALEIVQSYRKQLQRLQADFDNYRKRVVRNRNKERREAVLPTRMARYPCRSSSPLNKRKPKN